MRRVDEQMYWKRAVKLFGGKEVFMSVAAVDKTDEGIQFKEVYIYWVSEKPEDRVFMDVAMDAGLTGIPYRIPTSISEEQ